MAFEFPMSAVREGERRARDLAKKTFHSIPVQRFNREQFEAKLRQLMRGGNKKKKG